MAKSDKFDGGDKGDRENGTVKRLLYSKSLNGAMEYLTSDARQAFTQSRQSFTKALILQNFDPEYYIWIKTNALGCAIGGVLNELIDLAQWHPVAYYFQKMILTKTWYKMHNSELLAIIEVSKPGNTI